MCVTCGCGHSETVMVGHHPASPLAPDVRFTPVRSGGVTGTKTSEGNSKARSIQLEKNVLDKNQQYANKNRAWLKNKNILALNLLSSPGSGKTTLLTHTIEALKSKFSISVIEGDQQTSNDADKIKQTGAKAVQINTGRGCHLDAHMIGHALEELNPDNNSVIFIENVGNLVCPALFDLGEANKVVVLSVTEGEDKPLKYPDMFHAADLLLLNKIDLLPYVDFDVERCIDYARRINPEVEILKVSAKSGEGMSAWYEWLGA